MKRFIIFLLVLVQSVLYADTGTGSAGAPAGTVTPTSMAYGFMKFTYKNVYQHQNFVLMYASAVNQAKSKIESLCAEVPAGEDCKITEQMEIPVTQAMATASEIFYGAEDGLSTRDKINIAPNAITYRKLENSRLTQSVTIDLSKVTVVGDEENETLDEIVVFSWNDDGDILRAYYTDTANTYANTIVMMDKNSTKKMLFNGYFDDKINSGEAGVYIMEVQQIDSTNNGIVERLSYKDMKDPSNMLEVLSKGKIDNTGGYVYIDPFAPTGVGFNASGASATVSPTISEDTANGAILEVGNNFASTSRRFAIVKKGETVGRYTILGYIARGYEVDKPIYEYFGLDSLLAVKGATSDSDQLDIYALDDKNKPTGEPVTNIWLTKE